MSLTTAKTSAITLFAEILLKAFSDPGCAGASGALEFIDSQGEKMQIQPLYAAPQHGPQVAEWLWQAFAGDALPQAFFSSIVEHSQTPGALPLTFIATDGEALLGTVGLWRCDLISRQDLFPWMAALFVAETARGQGLAGKLQRHVIDYARQCGYPQLYLYSACRDFYERFGWRYIGEGLDYPATAVSLYRYDLSLSAGVITE